MEKVQITPYIYGQCLHTPDRGRSYRDFAVFLSPLIAPVVFPFQL
jgi:hypothetical protein